MALPKKIFRIALDKIDWVHGTVGMFMFILQESCQTLGMACFISLRHGRPEAARDMARHAIDEIVDPAIHFTETFGMAAYPLHMAYREFFLAARRNFETYLRL